MDMICGCLPSYKFQIIENGIQYTPEELRKKINGILEAGSGEEKSGDRRYLCTLYQNETELCYSAPAVIHAILFDWREELERMLEEGYRITGDMFLSVWNSKGHVGDITALRLNIMALLLNRDIDREMLLKCLERIADCRAEQAGAVIDMDRVLYNERYNIDLTFQKLELPMIGSIDPQRLCGNLMTAYENFPGLFEGGSDSEFYKHTVVPPELLLDVTGVFLKIYQKGNKRKKELLELAKEYLWTLFRSYNGAYNNIFRELDDNGADILTADSVKTLEQRINAIAGEYEHTVLKKIVGEFCACLIYATNVLFDGGAVEGGEPILCNVAASVRECAHQGFLQVAPIILNNYEWVAVARKTFYVVLMRVYRQLSGQKLILNMSGRRERALMKSLVGLLLDKEAYDDYESDELVAGFLDILELTERFEYCSQEEMNGRTLEPLMQIVMYGNEEVVRACIMKDLLSGLYVDRIIDRLMEGKNDKMIPLLLLKKYRVV